MDSDPLQTSELQEVQTFEKHSVLFCTQFLTFSLGFCGNVTQKLWTFQNLFKTLQVLGLCKDLSKKSEIKNLNNYGHNGFLPVTILTRQFLCFLLCIPESGASVTELSGSAPSSGSQLTSPAPETPCRKSEP
jgi:hypothetical protein